MIRASFLILTMFLLTLSLSSCGKYASAQPYKDSQYPRQYPKQM